MALIPKLERLKITLILHVMCIVQKLIYKPKFTCTKTRTFMFQHVVGAFIRQSAQ
jgi:hypothetical protein